jgi:hypothetical protein
MDAEVSTHTFLTMIIPSKFGSNGATGSREDGFYVNFPYRKMCQECDKTPKNGQYFHLVTSSLYHQ